MVIKRRHSTYGALASLGRSEGASVLVVVAMMHNDKITDGFTYDFGTARSLSRYL